MEASKYIKSKLEQEITKYPVLDYQFITPNELIFSETVRHICETECPKYGKSWSCPPAVGTIQECRQRCEQYKNILIFTTIAEVKDISNLEETLSTRTEHQEITKQLYQYLERLIDAVTLRSQRDGKENYNAFSIDPMVLSAESCSICQECTYSDRSCIYPKEMFPCIESYGILVTAIAEKCGITFLQDYNTVTWFSFLFF